jgi:hypothetical protein
MHFIFGISGAAGRRIGKALRVDLCRSWQRLQRLANWSWMRLVRLMRFICIIQCKIRIGREIYCRIVCCNRTADYAFGFNAPTATPNSPAADVCARSHPRVIARLARVVERRYVSATLGVPKKRASNLVR